MLKVFKDAVAVWHMGDTKDSGADHALAVHGKVELGVNLQGEEREESVRRGGDGKVARFEGGYLSIGGDSVGSSGILDVPGKEMTIAIRMRDASAKWNYPIFGSYGDTRKVSFFLHALDGRTMPMTSLDGRGGITTSTIYSWMFGSGSGPRSIRGNQSLIEFIWGASSPSASRLEKLENTVRQYGRDDFPLAQDIRDAVLRVCFPVENINPRGWHDLIVRFTGPVIELFIDGVCVDQEFPIGKTRKSTVPCLIGAAYENGELVTGFNGLIDHVAIWDRPLRDEEITILSGGSEYVGKKDPEILGPVSPRMQYYRPRGHNSKAGDTTMLFHDGVLHVYYFILRRNMHCKWDGGHGALEWHHVSTKDLVNWEHHPVAIPVYAQWQASHATGAVVHHDGLFHFFSFFTNQDWHEPEWAGVGNAVYEFTSADGIHFKEAAIHKNEIPYDIDIYVDEDTDLFHLVSSTPSGGSQKLFRFESRDLHEWKKVPEPLITADAYIATCPHLFEWNGWHYLIGGLEAIHFTWKSRSLSGPWTVIVPAPFDNTVRVPKTAPFGKNRRILSGFLRDGGWGGNLVFREVVQFPDGDLGTKFVPEMTPESGEPMAISLESGSGDVSIGQHSARVRPLPKVAAGESSAGTSVASDAPSLVVTPSWSVVTSVPNNYRMTLEIVPEADQGEPVYSISLRAGNSYQAGCDLEFNAATKEVRFSTSIDSGGINFDGSVITDVIGLDKPIKLDVVCRHDIIDVEINGVATTVNRYWNNEGDKIYFVARKSTTVFRNIVIRPLTE